MELTKEEGQMLEGKFGYPVQKSMEMLVALGEIYEAKRMIGVSHAHISFSLVSTGKAGAHFISDMANRGGKFKIPATLNVSALDFSLWKELGVPQETFDRQMALRKSYQEMGAFISPSCTPYQIGHVPRMGEHVAWCESSAVIFANSVLGARTNREGGPTALAAAITGRVPLYGYHLERNRKGDFRVKVTASLRSATDYGTLGYFVGKIAHEKSPVFVGIPQNVSLDELKSLGAALASSGAVALYHIVGVTPEAKSEQLAFKTREGKNYDTVEFGKDELRETEEELSKSENAKVDIVILGCPHASITEMKKYANLISGRKVHTSVEFWVHTSAPIKDYARSSGYVDILEQSGVKIVCETCPSYMNRHILKSEDVRTIATDSAKMAHYMPGLCGLTPHYGPTEKCIDAAITGVWR